MKSSLFVLFFIFFLIKKHDGLKTKGRVILVTGGGGYIGSHTVLDLLNNGYSVVVLDNLSNCFAQNETEKPESLKRIEKLTGKNVTFYKADIRNEKDLDKIFMENHDIEAVIHFAALKSVAESVKKPLEYYDNNVHGTNNLFKVMKKFHVTNLIYSSSATVYGVPKNLPLNEKSPTGQNITSTYGKTKYFTEEITKDLASAFSNWKIITLRYFNPVGAHKSGFIGENPNGIPNNLMPYISQVAVGKREFLNIFGADYNTPDGTPIRDYIHIEDLVKGHLKALEKIFSEDSWSGWKVFNLGTGTGYSVLEVVAAFEKASGRKIHYKIADRRLGDVPVLYANPELARKELGWNAEKNIDDMCQDTWNWQKRNPYGYEGFKRKFGSGHEL